jgi:hypothetical protein
VTCAQREEFPRTSNERLNIDNWRRGMAAYSLQAVHSLPRCKTKSDKGRYLIIPADVRQIGDQPTTIMIDRNSGLRQGAMVTG